METKLTKKPLNLENKSKLAFTFKLPCKACGTFDCTPNGEHVYIHNSRGKSEALFTSCGFRRQMRALRKMKGHPEVKVTLT